MNFLKNFSLTFGATIVVTLFGVVNNIAITRQIGPSGRGEYSVLMTFILLSALVLGEGIKRSNTILIGQNRSYFTSLVKSTLVATILIGILLFIANYLGFLNFFLHNIKSEYILIALISSILYIFWQALQGLILGLQKIFIYNLIFISTISITTLVNIVGISIFDFTLYEILISYLFATSITVFLVLISLLKVKSDSFQKTNVGISSLLTMSGRSTISTLASFIMIRGGIFFSNYYLGKYETGIFSIAILLFELAQKLPNTIGTLILSMTVNDQTVSNDIKTAKVIRMMIFIDAILIVFLLLFGKYMIVLLFGEEFIESIISVYYLFPAFLFIGPSSILYAFYMGKGYPAKVIILNLALACISLISLAIWVEEIGIISLSIIISLLISIWFFVLLWFFKHDSDLEFRELLFLSKNDISELSAGILEYFKKK